MQLELKIDVPDGAMAALDQLQVSPSQYAVEVLRAHFETLALGDEGAIENRPDWQAAILRGRAEIRSGHLVSDEEVDAWHRNHLE